MIRVLTIALAACAATSCSAPKPKNSIELQPQPLSVQASSALWDPVGARLTPEILTSRVHDLERSGRHEAAARLAALHGDVARTALEAVRGKPDPATRNLAAAVDRAFGTGPHGTASWSALCAARQRDASLFAAYDGAHAAVLAALARKDPAGVRELLPLPVPVDMPGAALLTAYSDRLEGLAALADGDPDHAASAFRRAGRDDALSQVLLFLAAVRGQKAPLQATARDDALLVLSEAAIAHPRRAEPALLERLFDADAPKAEPVSEAASEAIRRAAAHDLGLDAVGDAAGAAWIVAGLDRLARGEARAALTNLRRAEERCTEPLVRGRLREAQARALIGLGEPAAARAVLSVLAIDPEPKIARPALATLGAIELRLERPELALDLLRRALVDPPLEWPGASEAEANLGIALIATGEEEEGLKRLQTAQARFELEHDFEGLLQALDNEERAHSAALRREEAAEVRARVIAVERR